MKLYSKSWILFALSLAASPMSFARSQLIVVPAETGAYTNKADDGFWVTLRDVPFTVNESSDVTVTSGMTIYGASDSISGHNVVAGMLKINILRAAGGSFQAPIHGTSGAPALPAGSYIARVQAYAPKASANNYKYRYKIARTAVQISSNE